MSLSDEEIKYREGNCSWPLHFPPQCNSMPPKAFSLREPVRRECASSQVSLPWGDHWFLSSDDFLYSECHPNGKIVENDEIKTIPFISMQKLQSHLRHRQIANVAEVWAKQKIAMKPIVIGKVALRLTFRSFHSTNIFLASQNWTVEHLKWQKYGCWTKCKYSCGASAAHRTLAHYLDLISIPSLLFQRPLGQSPYVAKLEKWHT